MRPATRLLTPTKHSVNPCCSAGLRPADFRGSQSRATDVGGVPSGCGFLPTILRSLLTAFCLITAPHPTYAHPMGNFSISHYAGIRIVRGFIELRYLIDMAEIPTFQEIQQTGIKPNVGDSSVDRYLARKGEILKQGLVLEVDGQPLRLHLVSQEVIFPPGAGGLPTMKLGFLYRATFAGSISGGSRYLHYQDNNFPERVGWKEVIAQADDGSAIVSSTVPEKDRSLRLSNYPTDLLNSPPQTLEAQVSFTESAIEASAASSKQAAMGSRQDQIRHSVRSRSVAALSERRKCGDRRPPLQPSSEIRNPESLNPGSESRAPKPEALGIQANQQGTPRNRFTELVGTKQFSLWILLLAAAVAAGLGALHALEPGHGKTIVAAYLVGSQGTAAHALILGLIVTASHTAGVYALGLITLYASHYIVPEHLYPWLGVASGVTVAGMGFFLFLRRYAGEAHAHSHSHRHHHFHQHLHHHSTQGGGESHSHTYEHSHNHEHAVHRDYEYLHHGHHPHPHANLEVDFHSQGQNPEFRYSDSGRISYRELLALGVSGGIVPCPAALVVLLSAISLHRVSFGLFLIVAFSIGLAAVLIAIGLLVVYAGRFMSRLRGEGPLITRWLPLTSAAFITVLGVAIAVRGLVSAGILQIHV